MSARDAMGSPLEHLLAAHLDDLGIAYERQYRFAKPRQYRADFAVLEARLLVEVEGGIFTQQVSHASVGGIKRDIEKQALAVSLGWTVLRVHTDMVNDHRAADIIAQVLRVRAGEW